MPDNRRIQSPEETQCPLLYLSEQEKKNLVAPDGSRVDTRKDIEIRPMSLNTGVNHGASGSAYLELGSTKVACTVFGPKEPHRREDFSPEGKLTCNFKFATFSCRQRRQPQPDQEEKGYSSLVVHALQRVIKIESFPKLQLEVDIMVLDNGGSALAASIVCASLALATSGIGMLDLPVACSVSLHDSGFLVDPTVDEEYRGDIYSPYTGVRSSMTVVYLPVLDEVTFLKQHGSMGHDDITKGMELCVEGCKRIHQKMKEFLKQKVASDTYYQEKT